MIPNSVHIVKNIFFKRMADQKDRYLGVFAETMNLLKVVFENNGPKIPDEKDKIFNKIKQSTKSKKSGSCLNLSIESKNVYQRET